MTTHAAAAGDERASRLAFAAVLLAVCVYGPLSQLYHWPQIGDDAFIFFRYAQNLAAGAGPVWNPGQAPVEGFSSPLWVGVLGLVSWLGLDLVGSAKAIGVGALLFSALAAGVLARAVGGNRWAALAAIAAIALSKPLHYWAPSGMETSLYTALVSGSLWALALDRRGLGALLLGLAGLARPEGVLLVALVGGVYALLNPGKWRWGVPVLAALPLCAYQIFRMGFFGELLPNTYYAKLGAHPVARVLGGAIYSGAVLLLWVALATALRAASRRGLLEPPLHRNGLLLLAAVGAVVFFAVWSGGDWMWHRRFLCPALPGLAGGVAGLCSVWFAAGGSRRWVGVSLAACGVAGWVWLGIVPPGVAVAALSGKWMPAAQIQEGTMTAVSRDVALTLRERGPADALVAVNHAGAVPYYSELPSLDMTGLNDHHIAHEVQGGLHAKYDVDYVLAQQPHFIVLNTRHEPNSRSFERPDGTKVRTWYYPGYWEGETELLRRAEFWQSYRFIPEFWEWTWVSRRNFIVVAERIPAEERGAQGTP